jgi:hypothetical protein
MVLVKKSRTDTSEEIRLRYLYRNLVLQGKTRISLEAARRLVGPDCVFHLYGITKVKRKKREKEPGGQDNSA